MWRMIAVALLLAGQAVAQRRSVSYLTYSEAVPVLQAEALNRTKAQVLLLSGVRVKGRLIGATPDSVVLDKHKSFAWKQVQWIRLPSVARQASNVDKGFAAGATIGALLYMELRSLGHARSASRVWLGSTITGALIGSQTGRVDDGHYYVLRDDSDEIIPQPKQEFTLPLLPLRPSLPLPPR